jgi:hypothetical protein
MCFVKNLCYVISNLVSSFCLSLCLSNTSNYADNSEILSADTTE